MICFTENLQFPLSAIDRDISTPYTVYPRLCWYLSRPTIQAHRHLNSLITLHQRGCPTSPLRTLPAEPKLRLPAPPNEDEQSLISNISSPTQHPPILWYCLTVIQYPEKMNISKLSRPSRTLWTLIFMLHTELMTMFSEDTLVKFHFPLYCILRLHLQLAFVCPSHFGSNPLI